MRIDEVTQAYKLFLDDLRDPPDTSWVVARSYEDAVRLVTEMGFPQEVSFDHDLGMGKTGMDFAHFLVNHDLDGQARLGVQAKLDTNTMPGNFSYRVHSANPVGRANIESLLDRYMRFRHGDQIPSE